MQKIVTLFLALFLVCHPQWSNAQQPEDATKYPEEFRKAISKAAEAFAARKFDETLKALDAADKIVPNTPVSLNLRGAVFTEKEDYAKAGSYFQKALELDPKQFAPKFNLAELIFVQKKYKEAREAFEKLQVAFPKNELVQYKIYLTFLLAGTEAEAKAKLDAFKFPSDTPAYYFAQAAWAFKHDKPAEAQSWIQSSLNIFGVPKNQIYLESLEDLGWLVKNLQGNLQLAPPTPTPTPSL